MKQTLAKLTVFAVALLMVLAIVPQTFADGEVAISEPPVLEESWIDKHNIRPVFELFVNYGLQVNACANIGCFGAAKWDNSFGITRGYFGFSGDITDHVGFNFTMDSNGAAGFGKADADGINLKYAYVVFKDYEALPAFSAILGQQASPYIAFVENIWGWRLTNRVFLNYEGYLDEADLGVTFKYAFPSEWGDIQLSLFNGTGFNAVEADNYKDAELKLELRPFENKAWFFTLLAEYGFNGASGNSNMLGAGTFGWKDADYGTLAFEGLYAKDSGSGIFDRAQVNVNANATSYGAALYGELKFFWWGDVGRKFSWVLHGTYLEPDTNTATDTHYAVTNGLGYTYNKYFKLLASHQFSAYSAGANQTGDHAGFLEFQANMF